MVMNKKNRTGNCDSALFCVAVMAKLNGNPISARQIRHHFGKNDGVLEPIELARVFQNIGFKVRPVKKKLEKINPGLFPLIAQEETGNFVLLAGKNEKENKVLVQRMGEARGQWLDTDLLTENLNGRFLLLKKKVRQQGEAVQFGFSWFLQAARKYWTVLRDCMLASFFVQIFGLLSPLIFMIVIDKVLSNNSLSTLDVLVFALVVVSLFEIVLNGLRTYLMSHTANRIDLMLGVQLFKHLMSLPLSYFESRQVGDTIARMKELENVRSFITGTALMLILDLFFCLYFFLSCFSSAPF